MAITRYTMTVQMEYASAEDRDTAYAKAKTWAQNEKSGGKVSFTYDDATMLLTGASVTNSSGKSLQLDILSPRTHSVTIPAGNRAVSIPSNRRPTWEYADQNIPQGGTRRIITGFEW